jgi:hypothetical protein
MSSSPCGVSVLAFDSFVGSIACSIGTPPFFLGVIYNNIYNSLEENYIG